MQDYAGSSGVWLVSPKLSVTSLAPREWPGGDAGLSRESLYNALSGERSPGFATILKVIGALGL
ncbi:helix-turn-helix domain-containing transcriptional regulator [Methylococcus geothermalis]|uniref:helix-turn-helix domain-containing transcriptional regulator n=1 Tax=Methylococcus geothermalis TaxID=2681310 RepID=UPI001CB6CD1A|nr:hypothetical protein [Methylococcus geothermalis]